MTSTEQLEAHVREIARELDSGTYEMENDGLDFEEPCAAHWLANVLDVEYVVTSTKSFLGARILVAYGGPTIWVDTRAGEVRGYWGRDRVTAEFTDTLGLNEFLAEYWETVQ